MLVTKAELLKFFIALLNNGYIHIFFILNVIDLFINKKSSESIITHVTIAFLVTLLYPYLDLLELDMFADAFLLFCILYYAESIVNRLDSMGFPIKIWFNNKMGSFKKKDNNNKDDK